MSSSMQEDRELRKTTDMEESNDMTIEFLRARLLSERSVSKTARQRAEELAKRVSELEEQLKFVSLQRKKAEKATNDVLAILENHGISDDVSEEFDSSSEHEESLHDFKAYNGSSSASTNMKLRKNEMDAYSSSEFESSPSTGRSLSWKSTKDPQRSLDKKKFMDSVRRRASFSSNSSSARRVGKSCRRIRHRETRSIEELQSDSAEKITFSRDVSNCDESEPVSLKESSAYENHNLVSNNVTQKSNGHHSNVHERDEDMESALQHQAQLIGRYEEEEKAQREWEEKFRENNSGTQDSCDPGNHSDVTEERYETKSPELSSGDMASTSNNRETEKEQQYDVHSSAPQTSEILPSFSTVAVDKGGSQHEQSTNGIISSESSSPRFSFGATKEKSNLEFPKSQPSSADKRQQFLSHAHPSPHISASEAAKSEPQISSPLQLALLPQEIPNNLGSVLEALQQAKLSLTQRINNVPQVAGGITSSNAVVPSNPPANNVDESFQFPIGSPGLFRLPTDFLSESAITTSIRSINDAQQNFASFQSQPFSDSRNAFNSSDARPSFASFQSEAIATSKQSSTDASPSSFQSGPFSDYPRSAFRSVDGRSSLASFQSEPNPDYSRSAFQGNAFQGNAFRGDLFLTAPNRSFTPEIRPRAGEGPHPYNRTNHLDPYMNPSLPLVNDSYRFLPDVTLRLPLDEEAALATSSSSERGLPPYMQLSSHVDRFRPNMYR